MPQITIYLNRESARKVREAASREGVSLSRWARDAMDSQSSANRGWPRDYFSLFGSVDDETFRAPDSARPNQDLAREEL